MNKETTMTDLHHQGAEDVRKRDKDRFLDELMAHIILAGGVRIEPDELRKRSLGMIIDMCWNNHIVFKVSRE